MINKLIIINTVGVALLFIAHLTGLLPVLVNADKFMALPIIGVLVTLGLGLLVRRRTDGALWLANELPVVGLILTVTGLLWASTGDLESVQFKLDIIHALVANLAGVAGMLWIRLNARLCS